MFVEIRNQRNPRFTSRDSIDLTIDRFENDEFVGTFEIGTSRFDAPTKELFLAAERGDFGDIESLNNG